MQGKTDIAPIWVCEKDALLKTSIATMGAKCPHNPKEDVCHRPVGRPSAASIMSSLEIIVPVFSFYKTGNTSLSLLGVPQRRGVSLKERKHFLKSFLQCRKTKRLHRITGAPEPCVVSRTHRRLQAGNANVNNAGIRWICFFWLNWFLLSAGPGEFGCRSDGAGFVGMGAQFFLRRVGVRGMFLGHDRFLDGLVGRVWKRVVDGVMAGVLEMAVPVHAGSFYGGLFFHRTFGKCLSRWHNQ